jgi:hypothetical protein
VRVLIEAVALHLAKSQNDLNSFLMQTLYYHLLAYPQEIKRSFIKQVALAAVRFLCDGRILERSVAQDSTNPFNSHETEDSILFMTKLGIAIVKSGIDPDEGIIAYDGLFRARENLILDSSLHLLYLISPYDNRLYPNYGKLMKLYESSMKSKKQTMARVMEAIGVSHEQLSRWFVRAPSINEVAESSEIIRYGFLSTFSVLCEELTSTAASFSVTKQTVIAASNGSMTTTGWKNGTVDRRKSTSKLFELKLLNASKRLWSALIMQALLEGYQPQLICKEYQCSMMDIENLSRGIRIKLHIAKKLCTEMGWTTMKRILQSFEEEELKLSDQKEIRKLLVIPRMTHKIAKILIDNHIDSIEVLSAQNAQDLVQYLMLSIGFDLQVR